MNIALNTLKVKVICNLRWDVIEALFQNYPQSLE